MPTPLALRSLGLFFAVLVIFSIGCKKRSASNPGGGGGEVAAGAAALTQAPTMASLEAASLRYKTSINLLVTLLKGVTDEGSARDAGPRILATCPELAAAGKLRLQLIAALSLAGHETAINDFLEKEAKEVDKLAKSETLIGQVERAAKSPQGPILRSEINAILDAILQGTPSRPRAQLEEQFRRDGLRQ